MMRIILMVILDILRVPGWFWGIIKRGRHRERYTTQERYDYLRNIVRTVNKKGRVTILADGMENLPQKDGFILFPNHQGLFDVLAVVDACEHPLSIIAKKETENWILVRETIQMVDGMYMDRSDVKASLQVINAMSERAKEGQNFIIFPEGTRSRNGNELLEFHAGSFKSAVRAGCPVVPVALINSFRPFDVPSIRRETVEVHFLKPIYPEEYAGLKTRDIAERVRGAIQEKIRERLDAAEKD